MADEIDILLSKKVDENVSGLATYAHVNGSFSSDGHGESKYALTRLPPPTYCLLYQKNKTEDYAGAIRTNP